MALQNGKNSNGSISVMDIGCLALYHWHWFVLSLIVCVGVAVFYLLTTANVYQREASLMVNQSSMGKTINRGNGDEFNDLNLTYQVTNMNNEIRHVTSLDVLIDVARCLSLNVEYSKVGRFRDEVLYGKELPFTVAFPDDCEDLEASFDIHVGSGGHCVLSDFVMRGKSLPSKQIRIDVNGKPVQTPLGMIALEKNENGKKIGQYEHEVIHVKHKTMLAAAYSLRSRLTAKLSQAESTIIDLKILDNDINRADDVLATLVQVYALKDITDRKQQVSSASEFIGNRLVKIEEELNQVDGDISEYKSSQGITDVDAVGNMSLNQYNRSEDQILALKNQLSIANHILSFVSDSRKSHDQLPVNSGIANTTILSQIQEYNTQLLSLNNHLGYSSTQNPLIANMEKQLNAVREGIIQSLHQEIASIQLQLSSYEAYSGDVTARIESNPDQAKYLVSVERQQKVKGDLYLYLLQKREENSISQSYITPNCKLFDRPHGSYVPVSPVRKTIMLGALALGLLIPLVIIFIKSMMDDTIHGLRDLEGVISMPILGSVPLFGNQFDLKQPWKFKSHGRTKRQFFVREDGQDMLNEAFRVIRTNLEFMTTSANTGRGAVFNVSSYYANSGKTFVAMNLGIAFAIREHKTLVVDCDLRHASASSYLSKVNVGISNYLGGQIDDIHEAILHPTDLPSLSILPVGAIPPNPTELLSGQRFANLIEQLRDEYDYILLDCPPSTNMADTTIIEHYVDRTLFVIRVGLFKKQQLANLEEEYQKKTFNNVSLIVNGTVNDFRYGYAGYYSYNYGYRYSYYSKDKKS